MGKKTGVRRKQTIHGTGPSKYGVSERRQGRRFLFVWLPVIVVVVLLFYAFVFDPPRPVGQPVSGIAQDGGRTAGGEGGARMYSVRLDDGRTVTLDGSHMGVLEPGRRILVQENETLIFKRASFTFVRYIE